MNSVKIKQLDKTRQDYTKLLLPLMLVSFLREAYTLQWRGLMETKLAGTCCYLVWSYDLGFADQRYTTLRQLYFAQLFLCLTWIASAWSWDFNYLWRKDELLWEVNAFVGYANRPDNSIIVAQRVRDPNDWKMLKINFHSKMMFIFNIPSTNLCFPHNL